ncbi:hypothetical protein CHISP_3551 [Chitinispirillum alkaliphilum]|nr:hypothetical protein CHISP_3551 [Chitinispirillum alkaliphilum]
MYLLLISLLNRSTGFFISGCGHNERRKLQNQKPDITGFSNLKPEYLLERKIGDNKPVLTQNRMPRNLKLSPEYFFL